MPIVVTGSIRSAVLMEGFAIVARCDNDTAESE